MVCVCPSPATRDRLVTGGTVAVAVSRPAPRRSRRASTRCAASSSAPSGQCASAMPVTSVVVDASIWPFPDTTTQRTVTPCSGASPASTTRAASGLGSDEPAGPDWALPANTAIPVGTGLPAR